MRGGEATGWVRFGLHPSFGLFWIRIVALLGKVELHSDPRHVCRGNLDIFELGVAQPKLIYALICTISIDIAGD
ncbi:MAG: hypothetical protein WBH57_04890 [Anaerolineae bacterium]